MLTITINAQENWDSNKEEFVYTNEHTLELEHSLRSISKWESKWKKAFLSAKDMTREQQLDYIRCMTIGKAPELTVYYALNNSQIEEIFKYVNDPMTATRIPKQPQTGGSKDVITSELIYYWMVSLGIPFECQNWHLNRLLTLIEVCNIKQTPAKKRNFSEMAAERAMLNASRRKAHNSRG